MIHRDLNVHLWVDLSYKCFIYKVCWNSRYTFFPWLSYWLASPHPPAPTFFLLLILETLKENNAYVELDDF